jgi:predicted DNA-binding transcriptional regulator AlpA
MISDVRTRLRSNEAAGYMRVSQSTLAKWRMRDEGPPYHRCGPRIVYYLKEEIDDWQAKCDRVRSALARRIEPDSNTVSYHHNQLHSGDLRGTPSDRRANRRA